MTRGARWSLVLLLVAGCGDNLAPILPDAPPGPPDAMIFPVAPHAAPPQVGMASAGGTVLTAPVVVPVFYPGDDTMQAETEKFLGLLASSPYWAATTREYGVGAIQVHPTLLGTAAPTSDADVRAWLADMTDGTHAGWPAAGGHEIYTVFLPQGTTLSDNPGACTSYGGYHAEAMGKQGEKIVYAIIPRCSIQGDQVYPTTTATSHELIEAATDPYPFTAPAYVALDPDHYIWGSTPGGETGDMCEYVQAANQRIVGLYSVQRTWSNASAAAGHDPCVPVLAKPYQGVAPVLDEAITLTSRGQTVMTKGVQIPAGTSKTIEVDPSSRARTATS